MEEDGNALKAGGLHQLRQHRGGDVVGEVRADQGPQAPKFLRRQGGKVQLQRVPGDDFNIWVGGHGLRQHGEELLVQLDGNHLPGPLRQLRRQAPHARPDFQHAAASLRLGGGGYCRRDGGVNEKILSHGLGEMEAVPPQKGAEVFPAAEIHGLSAFPV